MKYFIFVFSFLSIFFTHTFSIEKSPCASKDVCCEQIEPGPFAFSYPKDISLMCPKNLSVSGSFLWMAFYEEGLEYAINVNQIVNEKQRLELNPGFRVNFNYERELVHVNIEWTYIRFKDNSFADPVSDLLGLFLPPETGSLTGASSRISGDFNTLDLNISKPYHVSRYYTSNPKLGIQAAWVDQDYHLRYYTINRKHNVFNKNDFWGVGLEAGYDAEFLLGKNFTLYANILYALLFSKFDISQIATTLTIYNYNLSDSFYKVMPNAKIGLGFTWSRMFNNKTIATLEVGYELQQWWSMNQLRRFFDTDPTANDTVSRSDLTFNGLVVALRIDI
ncbi:MAG: hypothetical protein KR126chlam6_01030 [Candidatus Anoxychlamydiales bacterium]|nr:hypothetical protein [Candidatus Anoxychlamydiales bacterium]